MRGVGGTAAATTNISIGANLPSNDDVGDTHRTDVQFFDTLGNANTISFVYTKAAANEWDLSIEPPTGANILTLYDADGNVYSSTGQLEFTTQPATTTPAPVPSVASGLLDLGKGVGVAVPAGWTGTNNNGVVKLTDGRLQITLVVLKRAPGEHPKDIVDEFVGLLIDPAGPADYSTCSLIWNTDAPRPAMEYELFYALQVQNGSIQGGLHTFIRDDGLTLLYDVWAPTGVTGALPDDVFVDLVNSFLDAPQLATPAALTMVPQFEVTTIHPQS